MAYVINPIDANPLNQKFVQEFDEFDGLMPKVADKVGVKVGEKELEVIDFPAL